ncbi:hypothetical protein SAMN04488100_10544 [Alkalibacterium putridalgicola]|uniref:Uncharacterized protein n=1 Tax=Alkalibacterium putridalgicola TaxID=426703 RepID=A0A1H7RMA8_9LACT|nr:hypothetical protein [Alkalibacterium putridalgicola]GEK88903.1 hypothetical protein APU01nite_09420 [Alkalibacterium putridalgicola]SEL61333.1 hypothetical protein SAMN04488100_10544 [Alkalibacterium putridalgicola]
MNSEEFTKVVLNGAKTKKQQLEVMKELIKRGYKWACREENTVYFYSMKPKKYRDFGWGYREEDVNKSAALPAYPIEMENDLIENTSRYPYETALLIKKMEGADE